MALSHGDHKRIALSIAQELQKVLHGANGQRILAKHKARIAPDGDEPPGTPEEPEGYDEMMAEMDKRPDHGSLEVDASEKKSRSGQMPSDEEDPGAIFPGKKKAPPFAGKARFGKR